MSADLRGVDFSGAYLSEADLLAANRDGAILICTNLHEADLLGASMTQVRCADDDLRGALHVPKRDAGRTCRRLTTSAVGPARCR